MKFNRKSKIRHGVFETNSSSTHSIAIVSEDRHYPDVCLNNEDNTLEVKLGEFGWGLEVYKDFENKLSYIMTYIIHYSNKEEELTTFVEDAIIEEIPELSKIIIEDKECGYIDHQSMYVAKEALGNSIDLKNFLFNSESLLVIDNDNR
jgi:hypothetical protein